MDQDVVDLKQVAGEINTALGAFPGIVDGFEKRISKLVRDSKTMPAAEKAEINAAVTELKKGLASALKTAADAVDSLDEDEGYDDKPAFDSVMAGYTGGAQILLDGAEYKGAAAGNTDVVDYYTHSDSTPPGRIDRTAPTS